MSRVSPVDVEVESKNSSNVNMKTVPRIFLAEFLGTFILCIVGIGSTLQGTDDAFGTSNPAGPIAGGIGVFLGIYCAANISGGHVNPAVTMSFFVQKKLGKTWSENIKMLVVYCW